MSRRDAVAARSVVALAVVALVGLSACSGQVSDSLSRSATLTGSVARPAESPQQSASEGGDGIAASPTRTVEAPEQGSSEEGDVIAASPTRTRAPGEPTESTSPPPPETVTATTTEQQTETQTQQETATEVLTETATARETRTQTARETLTETATVTAEPTLTPSPSVSAATSEEAQGGPGPWLWVLLALAGVAAVVAVALLLRRRRSHEAWDESLASAVQDTRWLAHEFLPAYEMQPSEAQRTGMWDVARSRVMGLELALEALGGEGADPARAQRVTGLLGSVRRVRIALDGAQSSGGPSSEAARMLVTQSQRELVETLRPFEVAGPAG